MESLNAADLEVLKRILNNDKLRGLIDLKSLQKSKDVAAPGASLHNAALGPSTTSVRPSPPSQPTISLQSSTPEASMHNATPIQATIPLQTSISEDSVHKTASTQPTMSLQPTAPGNSVHKAASNQPTISIQPSTPGNSVHKTTPSQPTTLLSLPLPNFQVHNSVSVPSRISEGSSSTTEVSLIQQARKHPRSSTPELNSTEHDSIHQQDSPSPKAPRTGVRTSGTVPGPGCGLVTRIPSSRPEPSIVLKIQTLSQDFVAPPGGAAYYTGNNDTSPATPCGTGPISTLSGYLSSPIETSPQRMLRPVLPKDYAMRDIYDSLDDDSELSSVPSSNSNSPSRVSQSTPRSNRSATTQAEQSTRLKLSQLEMSPKKNTSRSLNEASRYRSETLALQTPPPITCRQFVIGLDYGTTFTSVSYTSHPVGQINPHLLPSDVKSINNWPGDGNGGVREQVPTEVWYNDPRPTREPDSATHTKNAGNGLNDQTVGGRRPDSNAASASSHEMSENDENFSNRQGLGRSGSSDFLWGYEVWNEFYHSNTKRNKLQRVDRPKLILVDTEHTEKDRERLRPCLEHLIRNGTIQKHDREGTTGKWDVGDVIVDFLTKVLGHTKAQLAELEDLTDDYPIFFTLTIPSIWSHESSRIMQSSLERAIKAASFGTLSDDGHIDNLFIVSEPEAGATYAMALKPRTMLTGDTFTFMDCGGGTVDAVTYTATRTYPLRLEVEIGKSKGDNCGASYLNDRFEQCLKDRLEGEHYLENNGQAISDIARQAVPVFENLHKRQVDIGRRPTRDILVSGLRGDERQGLRWDTAKRFADNFLLLDVKDFNYIFLEILERVEELLREQLEAAIAERKEVKKVFIIGGFGAAPSLRSHLKKFLCRFADERQLPHEITLQELNPQQSVIAIASGAVLRALDLKHGPSRKAFSSYGFRQRERYEPHKKLGHMGGIATTDRHDGLEYVEVINYFILKNSVLNPIQHFPPHICTHTFGLDEELLCHETLFVNDSDTKSSYFREHPVNQDAGIAGTIETDLTFLKDEKRILPIHPVTRGGIRKGNPHYTITYELIIIVEARNLRYESRYPCGSRGKVFQKGQVCIASAFQAGTG